MFDAVGHTKMSKTQVLSLRTRQWGQGLSYSKVTELRQLPKDSNTKHRKSNFTRFEKEIQAKVQSLSQTLLEN